MSYDLLIEHPEGETLQRAAVEAAIARFPQLRKRDAESYRSAATELILTAESPNAPVDSLTLRLTYRELPGSFDGGCDLALGLAEALGARVVDSQLGETVTAQTRAASREKAAEVALWSKRLGNEFEQPEKPYVDSNTRVTTVQSAPRAASSGDRPWWKFWARE